MTINREGYRIITVTALIAAGATAAGFALLPHWAAWPIGLIAAFMLFFTMFFFRDPRRETVTQADIIFSPSDGQVVAVEEVEEKEYLGERRIQISVFMSIWNVHINWFPAGGTVEYFRHHHGKFLVAWHPKSSEENERTTTVVNTGRCRILFRQIAGFVARRIVSYAAEGVEVEQNSRAGFIKFGSRVDVFVPLDSEILVLIGDKVTGSQTPLARLNPGGKK